MTWTDVLEGIVKIVGVMMLAVLAVRAVPDVQTSTGETASGLAAATPEIDVENNTAAGSYRSGPRIGINEGLTGRGSDGAGLFRCKPAHREHR